jgi:hypothetical protein
LADDDDDWSVVKWLYPDAVVEVYFILLLNNNLDSVAIVARVPNARKKNSRDVVKLKNP